MENVDTVQKLVNNLDVRLDNVSASLDEILEFKKLDDIIEKMSQLDQCKMLNSLSYILSSLYFAYLKVNGVKDVHTHGIMSDLQRVKLYMNRVKTFEERSRESEVQEIQMKESIHNNLKDSLGTPAISSANFNDNKQNTHIKFENICNTNDTNTTKIVDSIKKNTKKIRKRSQKKNVKVSK
ncbi:Exosome complex protein [Komagataella phaffii CBS 7435]|uniref:Exosome complex protein n=2 Tax=Komagataella phaffii TaxID=460519 RepID=C4R6E9_KOMPG|nr:Hypothetical protein PAS_chr3_1072 [Komagataella phaffii GS115]AOA63456.1 GQ67_04206T0 [Komagataella phaffii]KAI0462610.1 hypothetical protein LJB42_004106 [Komagataella kurtzmanii]CAH2449024.1 Exosome complex protein [Komagataella phaffii CBS 7435]AOA69369.1 GQ68_04179T0 [Komagataella phaffii GS115]CAY71135.1 Hypothetical protein PAS_chr3_1072 [Komagataella phaffii GS115]